MHRHHAPPVVPGRRPRPKPRALSTAAALTLACLLALIAGIVLSAAAAFASPSSAVYPLKRTGEDVLLGLTTDRVAKANLEVKLSEERLKEAETEAAAGHGSASVAAIQARDSELRDAGDDLAAIRHRNAAWKAARDRFESEASKPMDLLEHALQTQGQKQAAAEVAATYKRFQADRAAIDKQIGAGGAPAPGQSPPPAGLPGSVPTPSPGG